MRSNVILQVQSLLRLARRDVAFGGKDARLAFAVQLDQREVEQLNGARSQGGIIRQQLAARG